MKHLVIAAALIALGLNGVVHAEGTALVIGNGKYRNAPEAQTAVRDANAVTEGLSAAGWTVIKGTDLDRDGMRDAIARFAATLDEADKVAVFYSGHALRTGGVTYLAPIDARADTLTDVLFDGIPLELVLRLAAQKAGDAVIFIDGAQLRGFRPTGFVEPGLAALDGPEGVLIVSAAEPGRAVRRSRWRDSRFARLIVDQFLQPGASVREVAASTAAPTYVTGNADDAFMLAAAPEPVTDPKVLDAEIELAFWRAAERSGRPEDYKAYIARYPDGFFVGLARARLGLGADDPVVPDEPRLDPAVEAENALNLSRIRRRQVQTYLDALGFDPRGIDGIFGRGTRNAIREWQLARGFEDSGYLSRPQLRQLRHEGEAAIEEKRRLAEEARVRAEAEDNAYWSATGANGTADGYRAYLAKYPEGMHASEARTALAGIAEEEEADVAARRERRAFRRARRQDTAEAYRDYLGAYPDGIYRDEALARLDEIEGAERHRAERRRNRAIEDALGLTPRDRVSVEQRLRLLGFEVGPQDGKFDRRTRSAIKGYQASRGIEDTGFLTRPTLVRLVRETNRRSADPDPAKIDGSDVIRGLLEALTR